MRVVRNCVDQSCVLCETVLTNQTNEMAMQALMAAGEDLVDTRPALNTLSARAHDSSPLDKWSNPQACFWQCPAFILENRAIYWEAFFEGLRARQADRRVAFEEGKAPSTMSDSFPYGCWVWVKADAKPCGCG